MESGKELWRWRMIYERAMLALHGMGVLELEWTGDLGIMIDLYGTERLDGMSI